MKGVFREYSIGDRLEVRAVLFQLLHRVHRVEEWQVGVVRLSCPALAQQHLKFSDNTMRYNETDEI